MAGYNDNASRHLNRGQTPYRFQAGQNGDRRAPTANSGGFIDAASPNEGNDFRPPVLGWPDHSQDNWKGHSNLRATGYSLHGQKPFVDEAFESSPSYGHGNQHNGSNPRSFTEDVPSQASLSWPIPSQQTITFPNPPRTHHTNPYESNGPSRRGSALARFDPNPGSIHGGMEQEFLLEVDHKRAQYNRNSVPFDGPANMTTNYRDDHSLMDDQITHPVLWQTSPHQGYTGAQPNVPFDPQAYNLERPFLSGSAGASTQSNMPTFSSEGPWSTVNTRREDLQSSLEDITSRLDWNTGTSKTMSGVTGYDTTESIFTGDLDTSATSLNSEVDMMASLETLQPDGQSFESQTSRMNHHRMIPAQDFLMEVRASTPCPEIDMDPSSQSAENSRWLPVPQPYASTFEAPSPASTVSTSTPDIIQCVICPATFSGKYRTGNLSRHNRQKHRGKGVVECQDRSCSKTFEREDARLKHYRRKHPHLAQQPINRGSQSSRRQSNSQTCVSGHESQERDLSNVFTWT